MAPDSSSQKIGTAFSSDSTPHEAIAWPASRPLLHSGFPNAQDWGLASALSFCADWQGKHADPERTTGVRILWSPETLFLRFDCCYREIWVFDDSDPNGRRDGLWDRDVAEALLQPDQFGSRNYKEFEVSPNGLWVDLQISDEPRRDLKSGLLCMASIEARARRWSAELAIPMRSLTPNFDPGKSWRANFFRAEGKDPSRAYLAWQATHTPQPQFHVPAAFGTLKFQR
jgi:alpha-galactosidase